MFYRRNVTIQTITPVATDAAYTTGQVIGAVNTISEAVEDKKGTSLVLAVTVLDKANQKGAIDLIFFNQPLAVSPGADGANYSLDASDVTKILGRITIAQADYVSSGTANAEATLRNISLPVQAIANKKEIYMLVVARGTINLGSASDLVIKLALEKM